jgi:Ser/Thr protein kinase RdoA (MazF antagonist)
MAWTTERNDLIHADLHHGNVLVHGEELCPIDFSFCGMGDAMFDVSFMISLPRELRPTYLEGYRSLRPVTEGDLRRVEGWTLVNFLGYCSLVLPDPLNTTGCGGDSRK